MSVVSNMISSNVREIQLKHCSGISNLSLHLMDKAQATCCLFLALYKIRLSYRFSKPQLTNDSLTYSIQ